MLCENSDKGFPNSVIPVMAVSGPWTSILCAWAQTDSCLCPQIESDKKIYWTMGKDIMKFSLATCDSFKQHAFQWRGKPYSQASKPKRPFEITKVLIDITFFPNTPQVSLISSIHTPTNLHSWNGNVNRKMAITTNMPKGWRLQHNNSKISVCRKPRTVQTVVPAITGRKSVTRHGMKTWRGKPQQTLSNPTQ